MARCVPVRIKNSDLQQEDDRISGRALPSSGAIQK